MPIHILYIPFKIKDEVKNLGHKLGFNNESKKWFYEGDVLPVDLHKYELAYVEIPYEVKDIFKADYNITWDATKTSWACGFGDAVKIKKALA